MNLLVDDTLRSELESLVARARAEGIDRFAVGVGAAFDGRILIVQRKADDFLGGLWELPGGGVEPGENLS